jgi:hypothetical protein
MVLDRPKHSGAIQESEADQRIAQLATKFIQVAKRQVQLGSSDQLQVQDILAE